MDPIIEKISFYPNVAQITKKYSIEKDDELYDGIVQACNEAATIGKPVICFKKSAVKMSGDDFVTIDGVIFKGDYIFKKLKGINTVFPYIISCGSELDQWRRNQNDPFLSYCYEDIRESSIPPGLSYLHNKLKSDYGLKEICSVNPGTDFKWPLSEQKGLFEILGPVLDRTGVRLDKNLLMYPLKSVSELY